MFEIVLAHGTQRYVRFGEVKREKFCSMILTRSGPKIPAVDHLEEEEEGEIFCVLEHFSNFTVFTVLVNSSERKFYVEEEVED